MAKKVFGIDIKDLVPVGKGVEGTVYRTPDNKALKVFKSISICNSKYKILKKYKDNKHFPKVYECKGYYMLREYIDGTPLREYIMEHGLSETLALNLVNMAEDFYNIRNIKLDGLNKHVLVQKDESVKIIDPRKRYYDFHKSMLSSLEKVGVYDKFVRILYREKPHLAEKWLDYKTLMSIKQDFQSENSQDESQKVAPLEVEKVTVEEKVIKEDLVEVKLSTLDSSSCVEDICEDITSEIEKAEEIINESPAVHIEPVKSMKVEMIEEIIDEVPEIKNESVETIEEIVDEVSQANNEPVEPIEMELEAIEIDLEIIEPMEFDSEITDPSEDDLDITYSSDNDLDITEPPELDIETTDSHDTNLENTDTPEADLEISEVEELELEPEELIEIELEAIDLPEDESEPIEPTDEVLEENDFELSPVSMQIELEEAEMEVVDSRRSRDIAIRRVSTAKISGSCEEAIIRKRKSNYSFKMLGKDTQNNVKQNLRVKGNNEFHIK